jgi:hypothetical protein
LAIPERWLRAAVPALYLAVAVIGAYPFSLRPTRVLPDSADGVVFAWGVSWISHQLGHDPTRLLQANVFHPDTQALLYAEPLVAQGLLAWPVWALSGNDVLTYNLLLVATLAMSGWTMFLLAREVTGHSGAAFLAGLVFSFTTANYDSAARIQIVSSQWTPLALLFLVRALRNGRLRDGLGFGVAFALQGLACKYYELFFATLLALSLPFFWMLLASRKGGKRAVWPLAAGAALAAALLLPIDLAQQRHLQRIDSVRVASQPATMASFGQALSGNWIYGGLAGLPRIRYDDRYFPGALTLVLGAAGLWRCVPGAGRRKALSTPEEQRRLVLPFLVLGGSALVLAFGDTLPGGLPGPYRLLDAYVPGYPQTRVPSRFLMFARLTLALLVAVAVAGLARGSAWFRRWMTAALAVLLLLEHLSVPLPAWPVSSGSRMPKVYQWLATLGDDGGPILEFPPHPPRLRRFESFWQHFSTRHWRSLINGFASYYPPHYEFVYNELLELPSERSLAVLDALGARYVVLHPRLPRDPEGERALRRFERRWPEFSDRLALARTFDDGGVAYPEPVGVGGERVYRVIPRGPAADAAPCAATGEALPRAGWRCEGSEPGCERALDGDPRTAFRTPQEAGSFFRVLFPRPLTVSALALVSGRSSSSYPLAPEVRALVAGEWRALPHRSPAAAFLGRLLHCPETASQDLLFEAVTAEALEVRLGPPPNRFRPWLLPELEAYP